MGRNTAFILTALLGLFSSAKTLAQSGDEELNLLLSKGIVTQAEIDSLHAAADTSRGDEAGKKFDMLSSRRFQLSGYSHIRYQNDMQQGVPNGMDIRRARLDFKGNIASKLDFH